MLSPDWGNFSETFTARNECLFIPTDVKFEVLPNVKDQNDFRRKINPQSIPDLLVHKDELNIHVSAQELTL